MDTQGVFDRQSTLKDNAVIFALSTLMSSVQIYNIKNNIQEDNLQNLKLFVEYGSLVQTETKEKPFQKLLFLVRDFESSVEIPFESEGGRRVVDKILTPQMNQNDEVREVRENIHSAFELIECYLMRHPGFDVTECKKFDGSLRYLRPEFVEQLEDFVPRVLAPEHLIVKRMNGKKLKAFEIIDFLSSCVEVFNSNSTPTLQNLFVVNAKSCHLDAVNECVEHYKSQFKDSQREIKEIQDIEHLHEEFKEI